MIIYKVYSKDYALRKGRLLGVLSERRSDLRGETYFESGLRWARLTFGHSLKDRQSLFVVPQGLEEECMAKGPPESERDSGRDLVGMKDSFLSAENISFEKALGTTACQGPGRFPNALLKVSQEMASEGGFYGFSEMPFELVSDPNFFYFSPSHREALASIVAGIINQVGLIALTGEPGTGKTALIHFLLSHFDHMVTSVVVPYPPSNMTEFLRSLLIELGLTAMEEDGRGGQDQLHEYLGDGRAGRKNLVVIVDDAQNLSGELVEDLVTLLEGEKHLQILLIGQVEIEEKLQAPEGRKLWKERGFRCCSIKALSRNESKRYIDHRLRRVGSSLSEVFTPRSISMVVEHAQGIPRLINVLCNHAFLRGHSGGTRKIDEKVVSGVIQEVEEGRLLGFLRHRYGTKGP
jgi:general secretion pathway protein A